MAFGLARGDVFLHGRIIVIKVFYSASVDETYSATDVQLIAVITCDLVDDVFPQAQIGVGDGVLVPGACTRSGVMEEGSSEGM